MDTSSLHGRQKIYLSFIQNKEDRTFVFQLIKILWTHNLSRDIPINSPYFSTSKKTLMIVKKLTVINIEVSNIQNLTASFKSQSCGSTSKEIRENRLRWRQKNYSRGQFKVNVQYLKKP